MTLADRSGPASAVASSQPLICSQASFRGHFSLPCSLSSKHPVDDRRLRTTLNTGWYQGHQGFTSPGHRIRRKDW
ncbi:hypothetical protein CEXT_256411 [Caerostris extrusa]|uniref:Uncharacterized protein n=1 Tax=Caerostris extrusa TaxID=172846 RepID=A0AAV4QS32_CAEEX|nr:hypothetical protein CEXT_256411 [Caerostris extrusa]